MAFAICPTSTDDFLDAQARSDPHTWGVRRDMPPPVSTDHDAFDLIEVTSAMREELGLAPYIDYVMRPKQTEENDD